MVHEGGKVGRSDATPIISFSVEFFDLKFLSFKFGNDTFIIFLMPRVSYNRLDRKIYISLPLGTLAAPLALLRADRESDTEGGTGSLVAVPFICNQRSLARA